MAYANRPHQPYYRSTNAWPLAAWLPNKQVISNLTNIQMYLNILSIDRYLIIYNATLSIRYDYLLPFIYKQMFISNIIYKLSAIIYKPRIIYKATTVATNKDQ